MGFKSKRQAHTWIVTLILITKTSSTHLLTEGILNYHNQTDSMSHKLWWHLNKLTTMITSSLEVLVKIMLVRKTKIIFKVLLLLPTTLEIFIPIDLLIMLVSIETSGKVKKKKLILDRILSRTSRLLHLKYLIVLIPMQISMMSQTNQFPKVVMEATH